MNLSSAHIKGQGKWQSLQWILKDCLHVKYERVIVYSNPTMDKNSYSHLILKLVMFKVKVH